MLYIQSTGKANVTLTHQSGKTLLTKAINNNTDFNVSKLSAALYYIKNIKTGEVLKVISMG